MSNDGKADDGDGIDHQKYTRLRYLLQQTSVYSKFLADKLSKQILADPTLQEATKLTDSDHFLFGQPRLFTGGTLRKFQLEGVEWLVSLYENGLNGLLADEMGLGKTVQCIAFIAFLVEKGVSGPFLIVGPLSTIRNWNKEFTRFAPSMNVVLYHGTAEERRELKPTISKTHPIVITSYEIVFRDLSFFKKFTWKFLIIDEGHRIKNIDCRLVRDLSKLRSMNRLLLTGTPLQNNLAELWSLLHFLLPDIFNDLASFESWFNLSEEEGSAAESDLVGLSKKQRMHIVSSLHSILKPFLLRRLKSDVESLPEKREFIVRCPASTLQSKLFQAAFSGKLREFLATFNNTEDDLSIEDVSFKKNLKLMNLSMQLRKVCNDPRLLGIGAISDSAKMLVLMQLIKQFGSHHKILIFSQMARMLDLISNELDSTGIKYRRIDGSVSEHDRVQAISDFSHEPSIRIFLLTTRSGGLGLNLTAADTVILYDSDWNPQADRQASARVHRIDQTRPVLVLRLRLAGSIEDRRMAQLADQKERLEELVISRKRFKGRKEYLGTDSEYPQDDFMSTDKMISEYSDMPENHLLTDDELNILQDRTLSVSNIKETPMLKVVRTGPTSLLDI